MKTITFLFLTFITLFSLSAQVSNNTVDNIISDNSNELEVGIDTNNESKIQNEAFLYPNPAVIGENVQIKNISQGEEITVFEPNGTFVSNQYIDLDKQLYTNDLTAGEYLIRTESIYLKLVVK